MRADAISFWFAEETLCPITLYELGQWSPKRVMYNDDAGEIIGHRRLFIGVHKNYGRRTDVELQTAMIRPEIQIVYSLQDLARQVRESFEG
jgi:hypothetical protein